MPPLSSKLQGLVPFLHFERIETWRSIWRRGPWSQRLRNLPCVQSPADLPLARARALPAAPCDGPPRCSPVGRKADRSGPRSPFPTGRPSGSQKPTVQRPDTEPTQTEAQATPKGADAAREAPKPSWTPEALGKICARRPAKGRDRSRLARRASCLHVGRHGHESRRLLQTDGRRGATRDGCDDDGDSRSCRVSVAQCEWCWRTMASIPTVLTFDNMRQPQCMIHISVKNYVLQMLQA